MTLNLVFIGRVKTACIASGREGSQTAPTGTNYTADYDRTFSIGPTTPDPIQRDATGHPHQADSLVELDRIGRCLLGLRYRLFKNVNAGSLFAVDGTLAHLLCVDTGAWQLWATVFMDAETLKVSLRCRPFHNFLCPKCVHVRSYDGGPEYLKQRMFWGWWWLYVTLVLRLEGPQEKYAAHSILLRI